MNKKLFHIEFKNALENEKHFYYGDLTILFKNHPEIVDKGWNNKIQYLDLVFYGKKTGFFYFMRLFFYKMCKKINNTWWGA